MKIRSFQEKVLIKRIVNPSAELPYPLINVETEEYGIEQWYDIPLDDKQEVFDELYPFIEKPSLDDVMIDIHENRTFKVEDFKVIRFDGFNMLVSPYYFSRGGTVLDWLKEGSETAVMTTVR
jgi:hypothetical protein